MAVLVVLLLWITDAIPGYIAAILIGFEIMTAVVLTLVFQIGGKRTLRNKTLQDRADDNP